MDESYLDYSEAIKAIISISSGEDNPSLSFLIKKIESLSNKKEILDNIDELYALFQSERVNMAVSIGVKVPAERKRVVEIISSLDIKQKNNNMLLGELNQQFVQNNLSFRLSPALVGDIPNIIRRASNIQQGVTNLRLLSKIPQVEDLLPRCKRYLNQGSTVLKSLVEEIRKALTLASEKAYDNEYLSSIFSPLLKKIGYLEVSVKDKDPGQSANILFAELTAANSVFLAKQKAKSESVSIDQVRDALALLLIDMNI